MFSVAPNIVLAPNMTQNAERKHRTQDTNTANFRSSHSSVCSICIHSAVCRPLRKPTQYLPVRLSRNCSHSAFEKNMDKNASCSRYVYCTL